VFDSMRSGIALGCFLLTGAAAVSVSGCGGSVPRSATLSANQEATAALRAFARCVRTHGMPGFPDPQITNGVPSLPDSAPRVSPSAQQACGQIAARIPPQFTSTQPVSGADLQKLLKFANCMRRHGVPDWPDPNALGQFPLDQHLVQSGKRLVLRPGPICELLTNLTNYAVVQAG
jgi:hypothetical protein